MPLAAGTTLDDTTWTALALILTILGAAYTWFAWRRSGLAAGMRGLAWTLLPVAAWLTGSLKLITGIVEDIVNWAAKLVFSPVVWLGIVVAGVAVALWVLSGFMRARDIGVRDQDPSLRSARRQEVGAGKPRRGAQCTTRAQEACRIQAEQRRHRGPGRDRGDPEAARDLVSAAPASSTAARHHLARRLNAALAGDESATTPMVVVDLDAFDANAADLVRRAGDKPVRLASKSLRIPALMQRALAVPGFAGVLAFSLREALWLVREGITDDAVMGYPSVDRGALRDLLADADARSRVTLMVDDPAHLALVEACGDVTGVRVAIDIDAGLRMGRSHVGPKRSPLHDTSEVVAFALDVIARGFSLVGVMTYEGQVAGVPDDVPNQRARSLVVRKLKAASVAQLEERRAEIAQGLREVVDLEFWNAGGSGSVESTVADPVVTEVAAGSGLLVPGLFDHYESFDPRPAAFYGLPVVRRPGGGLATVAGGGFVASGASGKDRLPIPWAPPDLHLTSLEGAGEVQTPLTGPGARLLQIGDWVWFRHAKSGELAEHTNLVHLLDGDSIVDDVPSYRGLGLAW